MPQRPIRDVVKRKKIVTAVAKTTVLEAARMMKKAKLGAVMVRRLKSELPPRWEGTPRFPERSLEALESGREDRS